MVAPLVISSPMPRNAVSVASVMMKGGRPSFRMPKAWKAPMTGPSASVSPTAAQIGKSAFSSGATTVLDRPTTAPTDKSMPPVMMTKVWPIAMTAQSDA